MIKSKVIKSIGIVILFLCGIIDLIWLFSGRTSSAYKVLWVPPPVIVIISSVFSWFTLLIIATTIRHRKKDEVEYKKEDIPKK